MPSLPSILSKMKEFRNPNVLTTDGISIMSVEVRAAVGVKTLQFISTIQGKSDVYDTTIQFNNVEFSPTRTDTFNRAAVVVPARGNQIAFFEPIDINKHNVILKCDCPSYRFQFEKENYDISANKGNWRRYTKVPGSNRGPVNPNEIPGICRHIMYLLKYLKSEGYIIE